jgi:hypothetical protein
MFKYSCIFIIMTWSRRKKKMLRLSNEIVECFNLIKDDKKKALWLLSKINTYNEIILAFEYTLKRIHHSHTANLNI